jgi:hypothetical protein
LLPRTILIGCNGDAKTGETETSSHNPKLQKGLENLIFLDGESPARAVIPERDIRLKMGREGGVRGEA